MFSKKKSKCKACGERIVDTGNFSIRIKPAKKIPRKAIKLFGDPTDPGNKMEDSFWGLNKFQTYLKKKHMAKEARCNTMVVKCGSCSAKSVIPIPRTDKKNVKLSPDKTPKKKGQKKNDETSSSFSESVISGQSSEAPIKKKKKAKRKSEVNAGLMIPFSLKSPSAPGVPSPASSTEQSSFTSLKSSPSQIRNLPNTNIFQSRPPKSNDSSVEGLRKMLSRKKKGTNQSPSQNQPLSLKDFLSKN